MAPGGGQIRIFLFGRFAVERDGQEIPSGAWKRSRPVDILRELALARSHALHRDLLIDRLWPDKGSKAGSNNLHRAVHDLRKVLGEEFVSVERGVVRMAADVWIDVEEFEKAIEAGDPESMAIGTSLYRGHLLADDPYSGDLGPRREGLRQRFVDGSLRLARSLMEASKTARAIDVLRHLIEVDPTQEEAQRMLMGALAREGRKQDALRQYDECARALGSLPSPVTQRMREAILAGETGERSASSPTIRPKRNRDAEVPLLGRTRELELLEKAAKATLDGRSAVVLIEGEAGIGKSRLLDELAQRLPTHRIARAKCVELDRDLAFVAIGGLLRDLLQRAPTPAPGLEEILPELADPNVPPLPPRTARARALESLVRIVNEHAPVALLIDDVQWADASTLVALSYLTRRVGDRMFLALAFRSEETRPDHAVRHLDVELHVELQPLTRGDLGRFSVPGLFEKTGGHPLFVVEYLRAEPGEVPSTLREIIMARAVAAGPRAHRILSVASVLGRSFEPAILARLLEMDVAELIEALEELCERRLLLTSGARFDFRHDLIRRALFVSVSEARRRLLHERALSVLEELAPEASELAYHAEHAGQLAKAVQYGSQAGEAALRRWANAEAIGHFDRAHQIASAHPALLEPAALDRLKLKLADMLRLTGRIKEAPRLIEEARSRAESRGDDHTLFLALESLVHFEHRGRSAPDRALEVGEMALSFAQRIGDPELLGRAHISIGGSCASLGLFDRSTDHCRKALHELDRAGRPPAALPMGRIAMVLHFRGSEEKAIEESLRAETAAAEQRDEETLLMARWTRGMSLSSLGRYQEAIRALESIAEIGKGEELFWHARLPNTYASCLADLCQHERSLEKNLEALENARASHHGLVREAEIHTRLNLAGDRLALGRVDEARAEIERVRRDFTDVKYARFRWLCRLHAVDSDVALREEDPERAYHIAESCLALSAKYGQLKYDVRGRMAKARALGALGERDQAKREARAAAILAEQLGMRGLEWRAYRLVFELGDQASDLHHAEKVVARIAEELEEPLKSRFLANLRVRR